MNLYQVLSVCMFLIGGASSSLLPHRMTRHWSDAPPAGTTLNVQLIGTTSNAVRSLNTIVTLSPGFSVASTACPSADLIHGVR